MTKPLKMYIFIKESLPSHKGIVIAHGVLMAHLKFYTNSNYELMSVYADWLKNSFRKVVCEVSDEAFNNLKLEKDYIIVTESGLNNMECGIIFCPRPEWPDYFKKFPMSKY